MKKTDVGDALVDAGIIVIGVPCAIALGVCMVVYAIGYLAIFRRPP